MEVDKLYELFYKEADAKNTEKLLPWINGLLRDNEKDIDLRYLFLEVLRWNNLDLEDDKEEPEVLKLCTEIIKKNKNINTIIKAKAYAYRGEMRHFGIDRRRDFDNARLVLNFLSSNNSEVVFLNNFVNILYPQQFRMYLPIYTNYLNLLII